MHSRSEWIVHSSIEETIDAFLDDKKDIFCQKLSPGKAVHMRAIPGDGTFDYVTSNTGKTTTILSPFGNSPSVVTTNENGGGRRGGRKGKNTRGKRNGDDL